MTKERMRDLLIIGMLPFLVVAYETTDWSFLNSMSGKERKCVVYHVHAKPSHRCETTWQVECKYFHGC